MVESTGEAPGKRHVTWLYIASLALAVEHRAAVIRSQSAIENFLHRGMDMVFRGDECSERAHLPRPTSPRLAHACGLIARSPTTFCAFNARSPPGTTTSSLTSPPHNPFTGFPWTTGRCCTTNLGAQSGSIRRLLQARGSCREPVVAAGNLAEFSRGYYDGYSIRGD